MGFSPKENYFSCRAFLDIKGRSIKNVCEKQESNLRTPSGTDLESASVGHLDILALFCGSMLATGIHKAIDWQMDGSAPQG